jgi:hypothetical protein
LPKASKQQRECPAPATISRIPVRSGIPAEVTTRARRPVAGQVRGGLCDVPKARPLFRN